MNTKAIDISIDSIRGYLRIELYEDRLTGDPTAFCNETRENIAGFIDEANNTMGFRRSLEEESIIADQQCIIEADIALRAKLAAAVASVSDPWSFDGTEFERLVEDLRCDAMSEAADRLRDRIEAAGKSG